MPQVEKHARVYFDELEIKYGISIAAINVKASLSLISCKSAEMCYRFLAMIFHSWH